MSSSYRERNINELCPTSYNILKTGLHISFSYFCTCGWSVYCRNTFHHIYSQSIHPCIALITFKKNYLKWLLIKYFIILNLLIINWILIESMEHMIWKAIKLVLFHKNIGSSYARVIDGMPELKQITVDKHGFIFVEWCMSECLN